MYNFGRYRVNSHTGLVKGSAGGNKAEGHNSSAQDSIRGASTNGREETADIYCWGGKTVSILCG